MIDAERWAEARRLHRVERYKVRAIARRLGLDPKTVSRALRQESYPGARPQRRRRGSILDAYREAIRRYVAAADLSAVQVHARLVKEHRYPGEITLVRAFVRELRRSEAQAFLQLSFLPGECAQVDWAHFGRVRIGRTSRRVSAFVMVLAHSRLMYIELALSERMDAFLEAHGNLYSVPYQLAHRRGLVLRATTTEVTLYAEHELVARHDRSYERGRDVSDPSHDRGLRAKRRRADRHLALGRMISVLGPEAELYAAGLAREHVRASHHVTRILALAERYGAQDVREALLRALSHEAFGADYVLNVVHQERRRRLAGPAAQAAVLHDKDLAAIALAEPDLTRFDNLFQKGHDHAGEGMQPEGGGKEPERAERS